MRMPVSHAEEQYLAEGSAGAKVLSQGGACTQCDGQNAQVACEAREVCDCGAEAGG